MPFWSAVNTLQFTNGRIAMTTGDTERFRLRRFVERLVQLGECEMHDQPIDLADVAAVLDGNPRATWFKAVGPEKAELTGNVMGSRKRLALALGTDEAGLLAEITRRLTNPIKPVNVEAKDAPVQQVVLTGEEADLCALPVHLQHGEDGAPYISAGLDVMRFRDTGHTNVGCRRIMLRGPRQAGVDMIAPSDARAIYLDAVARGEALPVAYVVGSHPCDFMAAVCMNPPMDELEVLGALRAAPVPIVKCVTNDIYVPADAEFVLEGYLDNRGHVKPEGPFGEYVGYYGVVKRNPVFHLTAITRRKDALFQTVTIGGKFLARTDTAQLTTVKTESAAWAALVTAVREPVAVFATPSSGGMYNVRVSLRQRVPGEARNAIAAVFGSMAEAKQVFVFDDDIDVFSDEQCDWALATRYQGDRDTIMGSGFRVVPLDPSLGGQRTGAKIGFDCTIAFGKRQSLEWGIPAPPVVPKSNGTAGRGRSVADTLAAGPASFLELMIAAGTRDGREIVRELDALYASGRLTRNETGRYLLKGD
jgi:UbiD family decarboxylase